MEQFCRLLLDQMGVQQAHMIRKDHLARLALGDRRMMLDYGLSSGGPVTHPAHLPNILENVMHKRMMEAYESATVTYRDWAKREPDAVDLRDMNFYRLSESPLFEALQAGKRQEIRHGDHKNTMRVERYGLEWYIDPEVFINDDMSMIRSQPADIGAAAAETWNATVYQLLTTNVAFDSGNGTGNFYNNVAMTTTGGHKNDLGVGGITGANLTSIQVDFMTRQASRNQRRIQGRLNRLVVPAALEDDAVVLQTSRSVDTNGNPEKRNTWQGRFNITSDGELDADSNAKWYAMDDRFPPIRYSHLAGQSGVTVELERDFDTKGLKGTADSSFGAGRAETRFVYRAGVAAAGVS